MAEAREDAARESGLERLRKAWPHGSFERLVRRCDELLHGEPVAGKSVLEVGAGSGFLAHYLTVCRGAGHVTALDEYEGHGSAEESQDAILALREALGEEPRVEVEKRDFLEYRPERRFDYVMLVNALHHIVETPRPLSRDPDHWQRALRAFELAQQALAPGGRLLIQELSCRNYCFLPKYRRAMAGVRWGNKQAPGEWRAALRAAGFADTAVRYRYPLNLPVVPGLRPVLANRLVSLLTDSSYVIRASAPGTSDA